MNELLALILRNCKCILVCMDLMWRNATFSVISKTNSPSVLFEPNDLTSCLLDAPQGKPSNVEDPNEGSKTVEEEASVQKKTTEEEAQNPGVDQIQKHTNGNGLLDKEWTLI